MSAAIFAESFNNCRYLFFLIQTAFIWQTTYSILSRKSDYHMNKQKNNSTGIVFFIGKHEMRDHIIRWRLNILFGRINFSILCLFQVWDGFCMAFIPCIKPFGKETHLFNALHKSHDEIFCLKRRFAVFSQFF